MIDEHPLYAGAIAKRLELLKEIDEHERSAAQRKAELQADLLEQERIIDVTEAGVSPALFQEARTLVNIQWDKVPWSRCADHPTGRRLASADVNECFDDAIDDFRQGPNRLLGGFFGVKRYDRWESQRSDHPYGYGPRHGYIWFSIGLNHEAASRLRGGGLLSESEKLAAIGWLKEVQKNPTLLDAGAAS